MSGEWTIRHVNRLLPVVKEWLLIETHQRKQGYTVNTFDQWTLVMYSHGSWWFRTVSNDWQLGIALEFIWYTMPSHPNMVSLLKWGYSKTMSAVAVAAIFFCKRTAPHLPRRRVPYATLGHQVGRWAEDQVMSRGVFVDHSLPLRMTLVVNDYQNGYSSMM